MQKILIILIRCYQWTLAPLWGDCCRFTPSCSKYCLEAIKKHGWLRGLHFGILRLSKCHPFHAGGIDQVP